MEQNVTTLAQVEENKIFCKINFREVQEKITRQSHSSDGIFLFLGDFYSPFLVVVFFKYMIYGLEDYLNIYAPRPVQ